MRVPFNLATFVFCTPFVSADHRSGQHWARTVQPMLLGVIKSVENDSGNDWLGNFDWAIDAWSRSTALDLISIPGQNDYDTRLRCPAEAGYIRVCNANYGATSWRGIASWSYETYDDHDGHIRQCTVRLNDRDQTDYEKKWLCHEIGHCLGLGHPSTNGQSDNSCMDYSVADTSIGPGAIDFAVLEDVYDHVDTFDSYDFINREPTTCSSVKIAELARVCDCYGPQPNQSWVDEDEYTQCVSLAVSNSGCNLQSIIDMAKCLPFDPPTANPTKLPSSRPTLTPSKTPTNRPTIVPTPSPFEPPTMSPSERPSPKPTFKPTKIPTNLPSLVPTLPPRKTPTITGSPTTDPPIGVSDNRTCSSVRLAEIARVCDCLGPKPNQPWFDQIEYEECVQVAVGSTFCKLRDVIDLAGCLPFDPPTMPSEVSTLSPSETPAKAPTMRPTKRSTIAPTAVQTDTDICTIDRKTALASVCDCNGPERNKAWMDVVEYEDCVKEAVDESVCSVSDVIQFAACPPIPLPDNDCSDKELSEITSKCNCSGKNSKKPWNDRGEYERCVNKEIKKSDCLLQDVIVFAGCLISDPTADGDDNDIGGDENPGDGSTCHVYNDKKECKRQKYYCKWNNGGCKQKMPKRHRQLKPEKPERWKPEAYFVNTKCRNPELFGISKVAVLVEETDKSCKYEMKTGNIVNVIDVLL